MIVHPAIIALIGSGFLIAGFSIYAALMGVRIIRCWDITSGTALQIQLERRTYLISAVMICLLFVDVLSLFLFINTADRLHPQFIGAMCAAGSLNVNGSGYPALVVKIVSVISGGIWILVNQADNRAENYPLIRFKYKLLIGVSGLLIAGAILQLAYFSGLKPEVMTTCCGNLFSKDAKGLAGGIAGLPPIATSISFFAAASLHLGTTIHFLTTGRGGSTLGWSSVIFLCVAIIAVISLISVYYYELPTHHCPFDILQAQYYHVGYPLYAALLGVAVPGITVGILTQFTNVPSMRPFLSALLRRHSWISLTASLIFIMLAVYPMIFGNLKLLTSN